MFEGQEQKDFQIDFTVCQGTSVTFFCFWTQGRDEWVCKRYQKHFKCLSLKTWLGEIHGDTRWVLHVVPELWQCLQIQTHPVGLLNSVTQWILFANSALNRHEDGLDELQSVERPAAWSTMSSYPTQLGRYLGFMGKNLWQVGTS